MKVTLYMATTIDGFIATYSDDSSWVSEVDWPYFQKFIKSNEVILMGRKTYEKGIEEKVFPYEGALNIVVTSNKKLLKRKPNKKELFTNKTPKELIEYLKEKGYKNIGIIGGGRFNGSMLKEKFINEIYIDVHPLILGSGIKLFENFEEFVKLKLLDTKKLFQDLLVLHYKVLYS